VFHELSLLRKEKKTGIDLFSGLVIGKIDKIFSLAEK
jgi:hypothetical protein